MRPLFVDVFRVLVHPDGSHPLVVVSEVVSLAASRERRVLPVDVADLEVLFIIFNYSPDFPVVLDLSDPTAGSVDHRPPALPDLETQLVLLSAPDLQP